MRERERERERENNAREREGQRGGEERGRCTQADIYITHTETDKQSQADNNTHTLCTLLSLRARI